MNSVIQIRDLERTYTLGEIAVHALRGVSFDVTRGEMLTVMGPSGSGKSTLMNILGCLDQPTGGSYILDGVEVAGLTDDQLAEIRNRRIGFVFQSFNLLARTPALAQCELPLVYSGFSAQDRRQRALAALESVGLQDRVDHQPSELSGGQQQRVAIARALVNEPAIILADEPTGNLDTHSGVDIMRILQSLNRDQGITVLLVTHDPFIARHTHRVIRLQDGKIVGDDEVEHPLVAGQAERPSEISLDEDMGMETAV
ncbi:MAG TPA: ABC transporter ATP-binding protein [Anaerolineales bacterium]